MQTLLARLTLTLGLAALACSEAESSGQGGTGGAPAAGGCAAGTVACGATCVELASSPAHCGACGVACPTGEGCLAGACTCLGGLTDCGAACANLASDGANCGACGAPCGTGQVCSGGICSANCGIPGQVPCGASCVDTLADPANCGSCGLACGGGQSCLGGTCTCPAGLALCGVACVQTASDPLNCGTCGAACAVGQSCLGGLCTATGTGGAGGTGGFPTGGLATGGLATGGLATGGLATGGAGTGGLATGGLATGGLATGGAATGGIATGGEPSGGTATGGTATGGTETGGAATGGVATGGTETGGAGGCQPSSCGSHKWPCWRMPNPAGTGPNPASYAPSGGVVRDEVTCLDWEQTPPDSTYTVSQAIAYCEGLSLGGYSDWRLPTRVEMASILDWTRSPATDAVFTSRSGFHKTGSNWILTIDQRGAGAGTDFAFAYNMGDGIVSNAYSAATAARLRCVRGNGSGEGFDDPAVAPPNQYTALDADQTLDNYTQLVWERDGDGSGAVDWAGAVAYCDALSLGGRSDWRLPTIRELATLVDEAFVAPSINRTMFPNTHYGARSNNWYWSSHHSRNSTTYSWALNFDDGFTGFNSGAAAWNTFTSGFAKCVRAP